MGNHPPSRVHSVLDLTAPLPSVRKSVGNTIAPSSVDVSGKLLRGSVPKGMPASLQFSNEHIGRAAGARDIGPRELGKDANTAGRLVPSESFSMRSSVHAETGPQRDVSRGQPAHTIGNRGPSADIRPVQNRERGRPASAELELAQEPPNRAERTDLDLSSPSLLLLEQGDAPDGPVRAPGKANSR